MIHHKEEKKKESIAEKVFKWLDNKHYIKICLKKNIINLSSTARIIQKDLDIKNFDAVIVAIMRYKDALESIKDKSQEIIALLKESKLEIKTGFNVYIVKGTNSAEEISNLIKNEYAHIIKGFNFFIIITDKKLRIDYSILHEDLVEVRIKSPESIEDIPGVTLEIYQKLFENDINMVENYSTYTDTVFLIKKEDLIKTLNCLREIGIR
jgi:hypothetical protein